MLPEPILVLGVNRSGTKWLCNEVACHPEVASVAHEDHGGIVESNLLTGYGRSFDLSDDGAYRSFLDFWTKTHFFVLAGGRREDFEPEHFRARDPVEAFRRLMDGYAARERASFWVQKVQPWSAEYVLDRLPDAHLLLIRRDIVDTVRSRLKLDRKRGLQTSAFRAAMSIALQERELARVCRGREVFRIRYERLELHRDETMKAVAEFIGLPPASWRAYRFPRNTSFSSERDRSTIVARSDVAAIRLAQFLVRIIPFRIQRALRNRFSNETGDVLPGTFRHLEHQSESGYSLS
jgi:Sulfotransferase family